MQAGAGNQAGFAMSGQGLAMIRVDTRQALRQLNRDLNYFQRQQLPFARAMALTNTAWAVQRAETDALDVVFDKPTPFTRKAFSVKRATKSAPVATVFAKDIQAGYLAPSETGGHQVLGNKRAILAPAAVKLNTYGNIPKAKLAALKAQPNVFIGAVAFKSTGKISGVWQRPPRGTQRGKRGRQSGKYGTKESTAHKSNAAQGIRERTGLKLLIRFADPAPIEPSFEFVARAKPVIERTYPLELDIALTKALATAR